MGMSVSGSGAGNDGLQMLGDLSGAASQISGNLSLTGKAVDLAASALQLPGPVKDVAKIAVGAFTADLAAIISGVTGLLSQILEAARTEYRPPKTDPAKAGAGYAPPAAGPSVPDSAFESLSSKLSTTQKEYDRLMSRLASGGELDQKDQFRLQQLQQKLDQMTRLLSSILKHQHEMAMVVIQNMGR